MKEQVILDVDTGHDDMVALIMAAGMPCIDIAGIVAVAGNQVLDRTLTNTLHVCELIGIDAPVYAGSDRPLRRNQITAAHIHGQSGLDGPVFPPLTKQAAKGHGVDFIIDKLRTFPGEITLVCTGPLTDIATAIQREPQLPSLVKQIVLMGGSLGAGNVTPYAEFNIYADPHAADIVFRSGASIVMIGLDTTCQVLLTAEKQEQYRHLSSKTASMFNASMEQYVASCKRYGYDVPAMHDPCCIAYVADPSLFVLEKQGIEVDIQKGETFGRTIAKAPGDSSSISVAMRIDVPGFWRLLDKAFELLP